MKSRPILCLLMFLLILSGCMFDGRRPIKFEEYSDIHHVFDLTFGWNQSIKDNQLMINGYARNNRYYIVNSLELQISLIARNGRKKTKATFFFIPSDIHLDESAPFTVALNEHPEPGDTLEFSYRYTADEGDNDAFTWINSFEVKALE